MITTELAPPTSVRATSPARAPRTCDAVTHGIGVTAGRACGLVADAEHPASTTQVEIVTSSAMAMRWYKRLRCSTAPA
ncbi:MAG TPA: hypothetical protein VN045_05885 [Microbacteriaceae bacterium]|nr:hypothetical protein [Microbacteriaceae bacterium]